MLQGTRQSIEASGSYRYHRYKPAATPRLATGQRQHAERPWAFAAAAMAVLSEFLFYFIFIFIYTVIILPRLHGGSDSASATPVTTVRMT